MRETIRSRIYQLFSSFTWLSLNSTQPFTLSRNWSYNCYKTARHEYPLRLGGWVELIEGRVDSRRFSGYNQLIAVHTSMVRFEWQISVCWSLLAADTLRRDRVRLISVMPKLVQLTAEWSGPVVRREGGRGEGGGQISDYNRWRQKLCVPGALLSSVICRCVASASAADWGSSPGTAWWSVDAMHTSRQLNNVTSQSQRRPGASAMPLSWWL